MKRLALGLIVLAACGYENSQLRLRSAVDAQRNGFHECYADTLAGDARAAGTMKMLLHVPSNGNGQIQRVDFDPQSPLADPKLQDCVRRVLLGVPIGQGPIQNDLVVEYTLDFHPAS
jgi:hypothetical protein